MKHRLIISWLLFPCIVLFLLATSSNAATQTTEKVGILKVISENEIAEIYIDGGLAGHKVVTIEDITVGSHYVTIKVDGSNVLEKMVLVTEGEQNTVVYKETPRESSPIEKEPTYVRPEIGKRALALQDKQPSFSYLASLSYGTYNYSMGFAGYSYSGNFSSSFIGLGLGFKNALSEDGNSYYLCEINANSKVEGAQLSSICLNIGGISNNLIGEIGVNFSLWQMDGLSVNGSLGYQAKGGLKINENVDLCVNYTVYNGAYSYSGYPGTFTFSQPILYVRIH